MSIEKYQNKVDLETKRKIQGQKFTAKKRQIEKRKGQVYLLTLQGFSNQVIAEKLGYGLSTIEKDQHESKLVSLSFFRQLLDTGAIECYVDSYFQLKAVQKELWNKALNGRVEQIIPALVQLGNLAIKAQSIFTSLHSRVTPAMKNRADVETMYYNHLIDEEAKGN